MSGTNDGNNNQNNQSGTGENNQNNNPGGGGGGNQNNNNNNSIGSLEDALKVIGDLRKENASLRTSSKSQADDLKAQLDGIKKHLGMKENEDPKEQLQKLSTNLEEMEMELTLSQLARTHGVPVEDDEYFRFKIGKKLDSLKENEELSEDAIKEVMEDVKKYSGFRNQKPNNNSSGVNDGKGGSGNGGGGDGRTDQMTAEDFVQLKFHEQQKLFLENKAEYDRLRTAAINKGLL